MRFSFKQKARDFFVSEKLPFELSGKGDALFVYFEKRNLNTHDVIDHLRTRFKISRKTLGIAWLKDKRAVAKQWISIYDSALEKLWGEELFVNTLAEIVRIIEVNRHEFPIGLSVPIKNEFHIRLRSNTKLWQREKEQSIEIVQWLLDDGYPNMFGEQRFGINGKNRKQWQDIMQWKSRIKMVNGEKIFKLQAFSSKIFNDYVKKRAKKWFQLLDGDLLTWLEWKEQGYGFYQEQTKKVAVCDIQSDRESFFFVPKVTGEMIEPESRNMMLTGPVAWFNTPLPMDKAGERESKFLERHHLDPDYMHMFKELRVFWLRRPLRVNPMFTNVRYQKEDLLIDFTLPAGSYASILVDKLGQSLWVQAI